LIPFGRPFELAFLAAPYARVLPQVSWVVKSSCSSANTVRFGTSANGLSGLSVASTNLFTYEMGTPICIYEAVMTNLTANTRYYYRPGDANTPLYSFMVPPPTGQLLPGGQPIIYGILADFGMTNDVSLAQLLQEGEAGAFDVVLHAGESHRRIFFVEEAPSPAMARRVANCMTINLSCIACPLLLVSLHLLGDLAYDVNSYKGARGAWLNRFPCAWLSRRASRGPEPSKPSRPAPWRYFCDDSAPSAASCLLPHAFTGAPSSPPLHTRPPLISPPQAMST